MYLAKLITPIKEHNSFDRTERLFSHDGRSKHGHHQKYRPLQSKSNLLIHWKACPEQQIICFLTLCEHAWAGWPKWKIAKIFWQNFFNSKASARRIEKLLNIYFCGIQFSSVKYNDSFITAIEEASDILLQPPNLSELPSTTTTTTATTTPTLSHVPVHEMFEGISMEVDQDRGGVPEQIPEDGGEDLFDLLQNSTIAEKLINAMSLNQSEDALLLWQNNPKLKQIACSELHLIDPEEEEDKERISLQQIIAIAKLALFNNSFSSIASDLFFSRNKITLFAEYCAKNIFIGYNDNNEYIANADMIAIFRNAMFGIDNTNQMGKKVVQYLWKCNKLQEVISALKNDKYLKNQSKELLLLVIEKVNDYEFLSHYLEALNDKALVQLVLNEWTQMGRPLTRIIEPLKIYLDRKTITQSPKDPDNAATSTLFGHSI